MNQLSVSLGNVILYERRFVVTALVVISFFHRNNRDRGYLFFSINVRVKYRNFRKNTFFSTLVRQAEGDELSRPHLTRY